MEEKKATRTIPSTFRIDSSIHKVIKDCSIEQGKEMSEIVNVLLVSGLQHTGEKLLNSAIPKDVMQRLTKVWA